MGTTTKMAIPYPEATGLVKDGWEDMKDIADQVDAKSGLVLLNTTSFSAVSSQSINDVFSANYDNYLILLTISSHSAADKDIYFRYRVSGADNSNATYYHRFVGFKGDNTTDNFRASGATSNFIMPLNSGDNDQYATKIEVFTPFNTLRSKIKIHIDGIISTGVGVTNIGGGYFDATTSFTGYSIFASTGDVTGTLTTYGYNK